MEDFAVKDFLECGLGEDSYYARAVMLYGWDMFSMHGTGSWRQLLSCITELDFSSDID